MANFAVAHLAFGQSDERAAGMDQRVRILAQQPVVSRLARQRDRVGFGFSAISPAVEDDEDQRFGARHRIAFRLLASLLLSSLRFAFYFRPSADRLNRLPQPHISYYCRNHL